MNYKDKFVGIQIYGYCNGYFGRDSYDDKIIIASGEDWLVAKTSYGVSEFAYFENPEQMEHLVADWKIERYD